MFGRVRETFERLDDWIVDYLAPEEEQVNMPSLAGAIAAAARSSPDFVVTASEQHCLRLSNEVEKTAQNPRG